MPLCLSKNQEIQNSEATSMSPPLQTPILFLIFNRPDTTALVFEQIRLAKPCRLYIAADGPRLDKANEAILCENTRTIVNHIDWECKVFRLFRDSNLGCGKAVSTALDWFFEQEEMGIILEDDCLPHFDFFEYCQTLLWKYKDTEIGLISGDYFQHSQSTNGFSYSFSNFAHIWGWATWKSVWKDYVFDLHQTDLSKLRQNRNAVLASSKQIKYWELILQELLQQKIDTWDYQLQFMLWSTNRICICPNLNLVSNIGFDPRAAHTKTPNKNLSSLKTQSILPLAHPEQIQVNSEADLRHSKSLVSPNSLVQRVFLKLMLLLKRSLQ